MATNTTNYQLIKPAGSEKYNISIFNDNWDIIDGKIKLNADNILKKQNTITGAATTVVSSNLTANRAIISNASGKFAVSAVTATELGYLSGVKSKIQTQIDNEITARTDADAALDSSVVKLTGAQTVAGAKTFTSSLTISHYQPSLNMQLGTVQMGVAPPSTVWSGIAYLDADGTLLGRFLNAVNKDGSVYQEMAPTWNVNGEVISARVRAGIGTDGVPYAITITPSSVSENSTRIATTAWVNTASSVVHTAGNETIAGTKTFTGSPVTKGWLCLSQPNVTAGVAPTVDQYHDIRFTDKDNTRRHAMIRSWVKSNSANCMEIVVYDNNEKGNTLLMYSDGRIVTSVPTQANANGTELVTAGWANSKFVDSAGDTMTGMMVFNADSYRPIVIRRPNCDVTTADGKECFMYFNDANDASFGRIGFGNKSTKTFGISQKWNGKWFHIELRYADGADAYTIAPTPSDRADNDTKIATTAWVNSASTVVHTSGNETIAGTKTFSGQVALTGEYGSIQISMPNMTQGSSLPETRINNHIPFRTTHDNGDMSTIWQIETIQETNGLKRILWATNFIRDSEVTSNWKYPLRIEELTDGNVVVKTIATRSTGYESTEIVTAGWADAKYVNLSGDQTITGLKIFSRTEAYRVSAYAPYATMQATGIEKGVAGFQYTSPRITFVDKNLKQVGLVGNIYNANLESITSLRADNLVNGVETNAMLAVRVTSTGEKFGTVDTPANKADNSSKIATTSWVNTTSSVVHTSGNEIIAGTKKFTGGVLLQSTSYVNNDYSQSWHILQHLRFDDKDGFEMGHVRRFASTGTQAMAMTARAQIGENIISTSLELHITPDGSKYAIAPATRATGYGSTDIATAGWVDNKLAVLETKINETRNYIISDTEPTSEDGEDGDIWFVYE